MIFKESEKIELKKSTAELKKALEDLCAFANTELGALYFGIADNGEIIGQQVSDDTIKRIATTILDSIEPRLYPNISIESIHGKRIIKVELKNAPEKPYFLKGKAYKRIGTVNAFLARYEIEKYLYERENPSYRYEKTILKNYNCGINYEMLRWFIVKAVQARNLPNHAGLTDKVILEKLGLISEDSFNIAGILTFGKEIQRFIENAVIRCAVFEGRDKTGRIFDMVDIRNNVFRQIDLAEAFIIRNLRKSAFINPQTRRREEKYELPVLAIREAVANAVVHRDYNIMGTIDIAIFEDQLEIWSPGTLPFGLTIKNLLKEHPSKLRNPLVAQMLYLCGYIEQWGTGIGKMNNLMKEYGLPIPDYKEIAQSFVVTFKRTPNVIDLKDLNLNTRQYKIMDYLRKHKKITTSECIQMFSVAERTARQDLQQLIKKGLVASQGKGKKDRFYVLTAF